MAWARGGSDGSEIDQGERIRDLTYRVAIEIGDVVWQLVERNQVWRELSLGVFGSQPPAGLQSFGDPTFVLGDRQHLEFLVGEFEGGCPYVMQRRDAASDAAQLY